MRIVIPTAMSGLFSAMMIGLGRAPSRVTVQKSLTVNAGVDEVYGLWADLENLPQDKFAEIRREYHMAGGFRDNARYGYIARRTA
mgnify:CR=1 FL=1